MGQLQIPAQGDAATIAVDGRNIALSNLNKIFWPQLHITKRDLLQYYADIAPLLLPHVSGKAMVMKRYPNGITGDFFFMKRAPAGRPDWIETCSIEHGSGNVIAFPMVQDAASLLWLINLGCIDLNPWYARCETSDQPEYVHFDLDPCHAPFEAVREAALIANDLLTSLGMTVYAKTSGGHGMHLYVAIKHGPRQHDVWAFAKQVSVELAKAHRDILTTEYKVEKRPHNRVLVDYNQNRLGATLASIYSVRPNDYAGVSMPVTWDEVAAGITPEDFTLQNARARLAEIGDLWRPLTQKRARFDLNALI